ncbi:hypothetical protein Tco_1016753 [Tanacetum coccineum]|uniref:Uncharacterized protein n=1 Tax=Tanacetum coccineum TaxID=301880 RepID=A0ABQ5FQV7_9ASTR
MTAIFHDMVEDFMEVFMDDFLVFGDSFDRFLGEGGASVSSIFEPECTTRSITPAGQTTTTASTSRAIYSTIEGTVANSISVSDRITSEIEDPMLLPAESSRIEMVGKVLASNSAQPAIDESPTVEARTVLEDFSKNSSENKAHYDAEKEAIHLLLTGIGDEIYSTVDAYKTAHDMWMAIKRIQHGESLNIQDVKTKVNEIRAEKIARNSNLLALVAAAQQYPDPYYQALKPHKYKGKEIAKPITPLSESAYKENNDPKQALKDKEMQKNLAFIEKYFNKLYKPTNNNLRTSSNSRNKNMDTTLRYMNENPIGQFGNQRTVTVAGARETVGSQECRKPKRAKDYTYHKEKMLLFKQAEKGAPLQAEQADWLDDTDEKIDEQELEAHYNFMAKIQEVLTADLGSDVEPLEKDDSNSIPDSSNMCDNDTQTDQNAEECDDVCATLANLIANLTLNTEENKKILKQLKKANASLTQELKECKSTLEETNITLGESNSTRDRCIIALQNKDIELEKYKTYHDRTTENGTLERKLEETLGLLA